MSSPGNQLAGASSPYLRQQADNPVHWRQWSPKALAEAAKRDVPILLSIGYAACHWCHVMAHESFDDDEVASVMNAGFVCVKVDREERPDIDAVYMSATIALTGQGGWPMTCFLKPDGRPFFCGTYYPKDAFRSLLSSACFQRSARPGTVGGRRSNKPPTRSLPGCVRRQLGCPAPARQCSRRCAITPSRRCCAPKFPPSALLEALMRHAERTGSRPALDAVERTAGAMARGSLRPMPSAEQITATVQHYISLVDDGTADDLVELYADDATVEDPVGGDVHIGRLAIRGFYSAMEAVQRRCELKTLRVSGHEAAFHFALRITAGDTTMVIEPIETMVFDGEGKITAMKAYWSSDNVTQL